MEFKVKLVADSENSFPDASLEITDYEETGTVTLKISDAERAIGIKRADFMKIFAAMNA